MSKSPPKETTLQIDSLANSGDGVGRLDNMVVFVPFALPGETVRIQITENKKSFARGELLEVLVASELRQQPLCQHFGRCGGCDWQNLPYEDQLQWKHKNLLTVLQKIAGLTDFSLVAPVLPSSKQFHYRNRIQVHVDKTGPYFFAKGRSQAVYFEQCPLASTAINRWLSQNREQLKRKPGKWELAEMADQDVKVFAVDKKGQSALGFRQVNTEQNQRLGELICDLVKKENINSLLDLYCGQGNWSLLVAAKLPHVHCLGVDSNPINITAARKQALPNTEFKVGDALELLGDQSPPLVILDPPRAGCSPEVVDQLIAHPPRWLVYISCHPATMARDLKQLLTSQYQLKSILPVDMFPQTSHLECLTILRSTIP